MIPDDELQANADATLPDFYGPTKWPVEILVPTKELAEMRDEITRLKAENEKLTAELAAKERSLRIAEGYTAKLENAIRASVDVPDKPIPQPEDKQCRD